MSTPYSDLFGFVRIHIPTCPNPMMKWAFQTAAREFCIGSRYIRRTVTIDVVCGTQRYGILQSEPDLEVIDTRAVSFNGHPLTPASPEEISTSTNCCGNGYDTGKGFDSYIFQTPSTVALGFIPDQDVTAGLKVSALCAPTIKANTIPDDVVRKWENALSYGALHKLFVMPKKDWSDASLASYYRQAFTAEIKTARYQADIAHEPYGFRTLPGF